MMSRVRGPASLERGDTAPWFHAAALSGLPRYAFDTVAGRHVLMLFFGSASEEDSTAALAEVARERHLFDDERACFFGVTCDPEDAAQSRIAQQLPGIRYFLDFDRAISRLYRTEQQGSYVKQWIVLDPSLRVLGVFAIDRSVEALACLRSEVEGSSRESWAPVLQIPNVFPADLCAELIRGYQANGGAPSGFMREIKGKTEEVVDPRHKLRRDWIVDDDGLRATLVNAIKRHLAPSVERAFQFKPTRIERYLVACYEAGAGHFRPHRDNTTKGTAHRRFAVTINLNAGDYDGGELRFPEFGNRTYRAPTGGAVIFSCSLLHEATPVTKGWRYAFLPFLYDEDAAKVREANNAHLGAGVAPYKA